MNTLITALALSAAAIILCRRMRARAHVRTGSQKSVASPHICWEGNDTGTDLEPIFVSKFSAMRIGLPQIGRPSHATEGAQLLIRLTFRPSCPHSEISASASVAAAAVSAATSTRR